MCVLQRSSAIHFENILLIDSITLLVVAGGWVGGLLTAKWLLSLQAIFNWTLIPVSSRSVLLLIIKKVLATTCMLESQRGGLFMHLCFASINQLTGRQKDAPLLRSLHAKLQSTTVCTDRPSMPPLSAPSICNCHSKLRGGRTERNTMT